MSSGSNYQRSEMRFDSSGLGLNNPTDQTAQGDKYPILLNVRQNTRGTLKQRPGLNNLFTAAVNNTPSHSIKRLNDRVAGDYTYVAGVGTTLQSGKVSPLTSLDTGWSGLPMSMVPYQPLQDDNEWMAVADKNKLRKVKYDGTLRTLGISAPLNPPEVELDPFNAPLRLDVDDGSHSASYTHSTKSGSGGGIAAAAVTAVNATRTFGYVYAGQDPIWGTIPPGWFSQPLNSVTNIVPGTVLSDAGSAAKLYVEEVHPGAATTCTVERLIDDGNHVATGNQFITVVPSISLNEFQQHAVVRIVGAASQNMAIVQIVNGPDNKIAFRAYSPFNVSVGDTITILPSVFGWLTAAPVGNMQAIGTKWVALPASDTSQMVRNPATANLANFSTGGRAVDTENDEMNINLFLSDPTRVEEIKVEIFCDTGVSVTNFYSRSIRPSDLADVVKNNTTAQNNRAAILRRRQQNGGPLPGAHHTTGTRGGDVRNRDGIPDGREGRFGRPDNGTMPEVDPPGGSSSETPASDNQWFPVRFKLSDLEKFGSDSAKNLSTSVALRLIVTTNSGGTVDFAFDDWWIGGGYAPDVAQGAPYEYCYRYRDSTTGARSNWSPPSRNLVQPHRNQVYLTWGGSASPTDFIDIRRRGGSVNDWRIIATVPAVGSGQFYDTYDDFHALAVGGDPNALEDNVNARPFTINIGPLSIANGLTVSGNLVYDATARFNTSLAQGTPLKVNGVPTLLFRAQSTTVLELYDNCGSSANAPLEIPEQMIVDQPLPHIFGAMDGWAFAVGDKYNPGRLYFFNQWSMDSTRSYYWIDVSDSSSALLNGLVYNGRTYVWSGEHMFAIFYSGDEDIFRAEVVTGGVGLYSQWALTVGDAMYWLGKDGIYSSDGATTYNITRRDLLPLFSNEGQTGVDTNTISAPFMPQNATEAQLADLRLAYAHDKYLYFDYKNSSGVRKTLVLERGNGEQEKWGWYFDTYSVGNGAVCHYPDEGEGVRSIIVGAADTTTSKFYTLGGSVKTDAGNSFTCQVRTLALDGGDLRAEKLFGDGFVDLDPGNASVTPTFWFDNFGSSIAGSAITGAARTQPPTLVDFNSGGGQYARNTAVDLGWTVSADNHAVILYGWGFSFLGRPEDTIKRATDYSDLGHWGPKELKGVSIECDTKGVTKTVLIEYTKEDGTVATISKSVNTGQKDIEHLAFDPVTCYEARLRPTDANRWKEFEVVKWHFEPLTDMSTLVGDWFHFNRAVWVQGVEIDGDTNNATVSTSVQRDFSEAVRTIFATHNGRGTKAYSFDPPFIAYMVRTVPAAPFRRMQEHWIFKPEAPIGTVWETQEFELGSPYGFARKLEIEYASGTAVTVKYYVDGVLVLTDATLPTTTDTETFVKRDLDLPATKGRLGKFRVESGGGVRVRENGTLLLRKAFGQNMLQWVPVAGDIHGAGAEV